MLTPLLRYIRASPEVHVDAAVAWLTGRSSGFRWCYTPMKASEPGGALRLLADFVSCFFSRQRRLIMLRPALPVNDATVGQRCADGPVQAVPGIGTTCTHVSARLYSIILSRAPKRSIHVCYVSCGALAEEVEQELLELVRALRVYCQIGASMRIA
jgi:hypothetical protein